MNLTPDQTQGQKEWMIRRAQPHDVPFLAVLSTQLGYPTTDSQLKARLETILELDHHAIYVAVDREGDILGWIHLFERPLLIQAAGAELGGLVVEDNYRGMGIGKALLLAAEEWTESRGMSLLLIRSNIKRTAAHGFYQAAGYELMKTSYTFKKCMNSNAS
jgi:GNAT superfamily N-acetyltransferase